MTTVRLATSASPTFNDPRGAIGAAMVPLAVASEIRLVDFKPRRPASSWEITVNEAPVSRIMLVCTARFRTTGTITAEPFVWIGTTMALAGADGVVDDGIST